MQKLMFIFNPHSGKGLIKTRLLSIVDIFVKAGYRVEVYPTQKPQDAKEKILEYGNEFDLIACSGGDGTLNEVVSGVLEMELDIPIGYIPSGSTNDFATSIKLPKKMEDSADIAVNGTVFETDIGTFNNRPFVYIAGFGAFTDVSYKTPQNMKNVLGHQAYIIEGMKKLTSIKPYTMKILHNDKVIEDTFIYGMVTNAKSVAGFKGIAGKDVVLNDGEFEVTLIQSIRNPIDLQSILSYLMGINKQCNRVMYFKTSKIIFESEEEIDWVLDGEFGGSLTNVQIKNHNKAAKIMVADGEN